MANRVANPGFEVNTTGWVAIGAATIARSTADHHTGVACLDVQTGTDWLGVAAPQVETGDFQGQTFEISCWLKAATAGDVGKDISLIAISVPGGNQDGHDDVLYADWTKYTWIYTWPEAMTEYRIDIRPGGVATRFFLDDVFIDTASLLDDCLPDADVTTTGWTTTPLYSKVNDESDATVIQATAV
jgi:hypothetical protein